MESGGCLPTGLTNPPQPREVPFSCLCAFFVQGGDPLTLCLLFVAKLSTFYNKSTHINNHVFIKKKKSINISHQEKANKQTKKPHSSFGRQSIVFSTSFTRAGEIPLEHFSVLPNKTTETAVANVSVSQRRCIREM